MNHTIKHIVQLDALRAIAAFGVILYHFLPEFSSSKLPYGWIGVDIFFVISGFLITAILLEQKGVTGNNLLVIKNFVIRRALRLFPIYYLLIFIFHLLQHFGNLWTWDAGNSIYYYTYTTNILFFFEGMAGKQLNHVWTLSIEEQFYLFWPWIVVFVPNRAVILSLVFVILGSLIYKSVSGIENIRMLTFSHFDTLGGGALIAFLLKEKKESVLLFINRFKGIIILCGIFILLASEWYLLPEIIISSVVLVLAMSLVIGCHYGFSGLSGKIFSNSVLIYLGKISYGLYLFHKPVPYFLKLFLTPENSNSYYFLLISVVITIVVAHLSYKIIESPFLALKKRFNVTASVVQKSV